MNNIAKFQNNSKSIRFLTAQSIVYSRAKRTQIVSIISLFIAISPIISKVYFTNNVIPYLAGISIFWTLLTILTDIYRDNLTVKGANIQEQFDTYLLDIKWNHIFVGEKVEIEYIIQECNNKAKFDVNDWYSKEVIETIPHNIAVLLCFKCNTVWGKYQRNKYAVYLITFCILYYLCSIIYFRKESFIDMCVLLSPSIPFLVYAISTIKAHIEIRKIYIRLGKLVDSLFESYKENRSEPTKDQQRQLQDLLYYQRTKAYKIPDWFYNLYRKSTNKVVDETIKAIVSELPI